MSFQPSHWPHTCQPTISRHRTGRIVTVPVMIRSRVSCSHGSTSSMPGAFGSARVAHCRAGTITRSARTPLLRWSSGWRPAAREVLVLEGAPMARLGSVESPHRRTRPPPSGREKELPNVFHLRRARRVRGRGRRAGQARHRDAVRRPVDGHPRRARRARRARQVADRLGQDVRLRRADGRPASTRTAPGRRPSCSRRRASSRRRSSTSWPASCTPAALKITAVYGGVGIHNQAKQAGRSHVLVATPGRLLDLIERRAVALDQVELLVLDEADRMLDMGFKPVVDRIVAMTPDDRQTLLFSATLEGEVGRIAAAYTRRRRAATSTARAREDRPHRAPLPPRRARGQGLRARARAGRPQARAHARLRPHQARRRPARQAARRARRARRRDARRQVAVPAREGARALRVRARRHARRDRRRRARHRRRRHHARHQLRRAGGARGLRPPHRPHRPRRRRAASGSRSCSTTRRATSPSSRPSSGSSTASASRSARAARQNGNGNGRPSGGGAKSYRPRGRSRGRR